MGRKKKKDKPKNVIDERYYQQWLDYIFNNEDPNAALYKQEFDAKNEEIIELIQLMCLRCSSDLEKYSKSQINRGLYEIFTPTNDFVFSFKESDMHYSDIVIALQSIYHLYFDLFDKQCDPVLSHLDEKTDNPLNEICYMLWDVTPLAYWPDDPNNKHYYSAIATVMEKALTLSNPACIESALHGLGHIHDEAKERAEQIINGFLKKNRKKIRPELVKYAEQAKTGYIL